MKLLNAFSLAMLTFRPAEQSDVGKIPEHATVKVCSIPLSHAKKLAKEGLESFVGHADACTLYSEMLGTEVKFNRVSVKLEPGETALVGQYIGPRLAEGATKLPEGAEVRWLLAEVG